MHSDKMANYWFPASSFQSISPITSLKQECQSRSSSTSLISLLAKRRTSASGGGGAKKTKRAGGGGGKAGGKTRSSTTRNNKNNNKRTKTKSKRENSDNNNNPMSSSRNSNLSAASGGRQKPKQQQQQHTAPPWQVLSKKDAKKNIQLEKTRREKIQQGLLSPQDADYEKEEELIMEGGGKPLVVSKEFLSHYDKNFLGWKRFNPSTVPSGMRFVASVLDKKLPPRLGVPEIAFLGRSNVGKSSLLNRLSSFSKREAGFTDEARVGKTPGATASVNLYAFYDKKERPILGFVDLPGFGYAKLSKGVKESVQQTAEKYLGKRSELVLGILLVDIRRRPSEDDRIVLAALYDMGVPIVVVSTKLDKVSKNEIDIRLEDIREGLGLPEGQPLCVSSVTGEGTKPLWNLIFEACEIGVEEFRKKFERGGANDEDLDDHYDDYDESEDGFFDDEMEESYYSQGYDWIQDTGRIQASSNRKNVFEHGGDDNNRDANDDGFLDDYDSLDEDMTPFRESIKDLKKKARRLERGGGV